jgi:CDP-glucose 4,6-dehydratase
LPAEKDSLYERAARIAAIPEVFADIRDYQALEDFIDLQKPSTIMHMAAHPLVLKSYENPRATFDVNVMGSVNVLEIAFKKEFVKSVLVVTTDKVYKNNDSGRAFIESDPLEGKDPYSASKVATEAAVAAWQQIAKVSGGPSVTVGRGGNVIGGGDVCADRLIPDLVSSYSAGLTPKLRAHNSVRPWQHVLDCLNGYLILVDELIQNNVDGAWNFGPDENQSKTVADVANIAGAVWGAEKSWESDLGNHLHEASVLMLNSDKARAELGWSDKLTFEESVQWTTNWYKNVNSGSDPLEETLKSIREFEAI